MVKLDFCHGPPHQTTDPNAEFKYSCLDGPLFSSGYGEEQASTPNEFDGAVESIIIYPHNDLPPTQSCFPAIYTNSGCEAGIPTDTEAWYEKRFLADGEKIADVPGEFELI